MKNIHRQNLLKKNKRQAYKLGLALKIGIDAYIIFTQNQKTTTPDMAIKMAIKNIPKHISLTASDRKIIIPAIKDALSNIL